MHRSITGGISDGSETTRNDQLSSGKGGGEESTYCCLIYVMLDLLAIMYVRPTV